MQTANVNVPVKVTGRHVSITEAIKNYAITKIEHLHLDYPRIIEAQISGGMIFGLSAAMTGKITVAEGRVEQSSFPDFDPLRMSQCPPITVRILESGTLRGIGEPGTPPAAPALANAIFALTGVRHRKLPLADVVTFA